ncbi:MAG: phosphatidylglycerophosphatase A [Dissulfurispiraceae bacterium]
MRNIYVSVSRILATLFFIGYIPFAPGTLGSLFGALAVWVFKLDSRQLVIIIFTGFTVGVLASHSAEKSYGEKDCSFIVIDEFIGYFVSVVFLPLTLGYIVSAFFLFRFFDILKPPPIRQIEKAVSGGMGIMLDDVLAGMVSNLILQVWRVL